MSDEVVHYMEATSRLRAEREALRQNAVQNGEQAQKWCARAVAAEATMREVAEELRRRNSKGWEKPNVHLEALADRLDPS